MPTPMIPALILVIFAASFVQASAGFGFALVAVAILSLLAPLQQVTPLLALLNVPVTVYLLLKLRRFLNLRAIWPLMAGVAVGVPFGVHVLVNWRQDVLLRILGAVLLIAAVRSATRNSQEAASGCQQPGAIDSALALGAGWVSGALGGAFGTSGPPLIAYVYCRPWGKEQRTAALQALFFLVILFAIPMFCVKGLYDTALLKTAGLCVPGAVAGMVLGHALFRKIPRRALELFVAAFLTLIGIKLLVWA